MRVIATWSLAVVLVPGARADTAATIDAHAEVAAVRFAASATQAAMAKSVDASMRSQQDRINALAAELKARNSQHRAETIAAQEAFVTEFSAKDREYAAQIALFRNTVSDIASTPEGASALERFNAGDEVGAIAILDRLRAANEQMREARAKLQDAAQGRRIARLALEARTRGKITTQAVIARFEEVVRLDPGESADWTELDWLYLNAGRRTDAKRAVDALAAIAHDNHQRSIAFYERSNVLLAQGDLAGARAAAQQAVATSRRLAAADPKNADLDFTLSRMLISFGEIARRQGDLAAAQKSYMDEIAMARRRVAADPSNARVRNIPGSDQLHLADIRVPRGDMRGARAALEENLAIGRRLICR